MNANRHAQLGQVITKGIDILLQQQENNTKAPTTTDLITVLDILRDKMHQTSKYVGVPFYTPVKKSEQRTEHEFFRSVMGEMKELLLVRPSLYDDVDFRDTIKYMVSPIMNRLNLFPHHAALAACDTIINKARNQLLADNI